MINPYEVLGVKESSTDEEIAKAYKSLARTYHPDVNPSKEANEKMVAINCAYDEIKRLRENGESFAIYSSRSEFSKRTYYQDAYTSSVYQEKLFYQIERAIMAHCFFEAFLLLQSAPIRNSKWYYYSSIIYAQTGNITQAKEYIDEAIRMNPNLKEYTIMKEKIINAEINEDKYQPYRRNSFASTIFLFIMILVFLSIIVGCFSIVL